MVKQLWPRKAQPRWPRRFRTSSYRPVGFADIENAPRAKGYPGKPATRPRRIQTDLFMKLRIFGWQAPIVLSIHELYQWFSQPESLTSEFKVQIADCILSAPHYIPPHNHGSF
jgi:hypothetical protein